MNKICYDRGKTSGSKTKILKLQMLHVNVANLNVYTSKRNTRYLNA